MDLAVSDRRAQLPRQIFAKCLNPSVLVNAPYARAELRQFLLDVFVATIQMVDPLDRRFTSRYKASNHQARGCPQIGRHHRGTL